MSRFPAPAFRHAAARRSLLTGLAAALTLGACAVDDPTAPTRTPDAPSAALVGPYCFQTRSQPDLIATLERAGPMQYVSATTRRVPVAGVVKNVGSACARTFRVEGYQWTGDGGFATHVEFDATPAITAAGFTTAPLNAGASIRFSGTILVGVNYAAEPAAVRLKADACDYVDEETMPAYCRVAESNETNNATDWVTAYLP